MLHEHWRSQRPRLPDGRFQPRIKTLGGFEYDIANLAFKELPLYYKRDNLLAAAVACESIRKHWAQLTAEEERARGKRPGASPPPDEGERERELLSRFVETVQGPAFVEAASAEQHEAWLKRNGRFDWVTEEQKRPYALLGDVEKQKDRDIVLLGVRVYLAQIGVL